ncbi:MAG TPA: hypothetical protein VFK84_15495 [Burkholderiales bacterium]|nr:hypothetical protein [Burkholderiales bacterium]
MKRLLIAVAFALPFTASAQVAPRSDTAEPPNIARSMCDALAGSERERCLAEQNRSPDAEKDRPAAGGGSDTRRNCDDLLGPERDACMKKGGRIKAGMGATRPTQ